MNTQTRAEAQTQRPIRPQPAPQDRRHRRIMLVTTRCSTLVALQRACRGDSIVQFCFYANAAAAARALRWFRPDAVLFDVAGSGRAGIDLARGVRQMAAPPTVAVLADNIGPRMGQAVERLGGDGGLPVAAPDLLDRLGALACRSARAPAVTA